MEISERIFHLLMPVLNEVHEVDFSLRFWKIVMNDYVNAVISIKNLLEQEDINIRPTLQAVNSHHIPTLKEKLAARFPSLIKHYKTYGNLRRILHILSENDNVSIGLPALDIVRKETGHPLPLYYPVYPGKGNKTKRQRINTIAKRYSDPYQRNVIIGLPQVYVEFFDNDLDRIKISSPASKVFHTHGMPPYFNALLLAKYAENGAKFFCYQHGAYYGELIGHNSYLHESSLSDEYRTWGWKIQPNDRPWKAYRLEKFKREYDTVSKTGKFDFLMCYPDVHDDIINFYKNSTQYFLDKIDTDKYKSLLARPRPMNRIFSHAKRLSFIKDSRVTIDSGLGKMAETMGKCKLVIQFTIPATNFMECLYVDHPTIGLLDNDQPTGIIKPYYNFLMQQGVIHKDFISLVDHLNHIKVDEWWASVIKEPMYMQFKNEFLRKV
jgi:putative transferase (TIGR04331 family)